MEVPFNDLKRRGPELSEALASCIQRVFESGWYILGQECQAFESKFAAYCGCEDIVAAGNGTDALELALRCCGCDPGDEVITAANAGGYAATAALQIGAIPVFADVDPVSLTLAPGAVAALLGTKTRAVVATHLFGQLADMAGLREALAGSRAVLLEDCAQAHGAALAGQRAGSLADLSAFSFYPTKNLGALGDAGAVGTMRKDYAERLRALRQYGWKTRYDMEIPGGRNSRMDEFQAAVLRTKLPFLDGWNQRRREIMSQYIEAARGSALRFPQTPGESHVAHLCAGLHPDREAFQIRMHNLGVATAIHYPRLDTQQTAVLAAPHRAGPLPIAEAMPSQIVSIPCFPELTDEEVTHVCACLKTCA